MIRKAIAYFCAFVFLCQHQLVAKNLSRDELEYYLSRAITMQGIVDLKTCNSQACEITLHEPYFPEAYNASIRMLTNIEARFVGRLCGLWILESKINNGYFRHIEETIHDIHVAFEKSNLQQPILQAGIFEIVSSGVNEVAIPNEIANEFGELPRNFDYRKMAYDDYPSNNKHKTHWDIETEVVPDISKLETQMWFYYLATKYLDLGIEALHFGQTEMMDDNDKGHVIYFNLLNKIRTYASKRNRGFVLCDSHTKGAYYKNTNQLLFDFHSYPLRIKQQIGKNWGTNNGGPAILDKSYCGAIYGKSLGGKTYFGWTCESLPYLVEFDNYGISNYPNNDSTVCFPWGWDEITWFGFQIKNYKNAWLKYAFHRIKELDTNGFLQVVGTRRYSGLINNRPCNVYIASNEYDGQESTIKLLWNNYYKP